MAIVNKKGADRCVIDKAISSPRKWCVDLSKNMFKKLQLLPFAYNDYSNSNVNFLQSTKSYCVSA